MVRWANFDRANDIEFAIFWLFDLYWVAEITYSDLHFFVQKNVCHVEVPVYQQDLFHLDKSTDHLLRNALNFNFKEFAASFLKIVESTIWAEFWNHVPVVAIAVHATQCDEIRMCLNSL